MNKMGVPGLDLCGLGYGQLLDCSEENNTFSVSLKFGAFLEQGKKYAS